MKKINAEENFKKFTDWYNHVPTPEELEQRHIAEEAMLERLNGEFISYEETEEDEKRESLRHLYDTDMLTRNLARNGREVLCYIDPDNGRCVSIYIDTLEELTEEEIEEQLA